MYQTCYYNFLKFFRLVREAYQYSPFSMIFETVLDFVDIAAATSVALESTRGQ